MLNPQSVDSYSGHINNHNRKTLHSLCQPSSRINKGPYDEEIKQKMEEISFIKLKQTSWQKPNGSGSVGGDHCTLLNDHQSRCLSVRTERSVGMEFHSVETISNMYTVYSQCCDCERAAKTAAVLSTQGLPPTNGTVQRDSCLNNGEEKNFNPPPLNFSIESILYGPSRPGERDRTVLYIVYKYILYIHPFALAQLISLPVP